MTKYIIMFLMLASAVFGADVTMFLGGTGDQSGAGRVAGCIKSATWIVNGGFIEASDIMPAGLPLVDEVVVSLTSIGGGKYKVDGAGAIFTSVTTDFYAFLEVIGGGSNATGYYEITVKNSTSEIEVLDTSLEPNFLINDESMTMFVGGAGDISLNTGVDNDDFQDRIDEIGRDVATNANNVDVLINRDITTDSTIDIDAPTGSTTTRVRFIGTVYDESTADNNFVDDGTQVTITTESAITALLEFTTVDYIDFYNFEFYGGGAARAASCIYSNDTTVVAIGFQDCLIHGGITAGFNFKGNFWSIVNCEIHTCGTGILNGLNSGNESLIANNSIHGCTSDGMFLKGGRVLVTHNRVYANDGNGIKDQGVGHSSDITYNTLYSNGGDGVYLIQYHNIVIGNTIINSGGYNYNLSNANALNLQSFAYNHSFNPGTAHANANGTDISTDAAWADFSYGDNITGAPKFNNILELTDLVSTAGSKVVTSATGGFTADMEGRNLEIASGTNFVAGSYEIVTYTSTGSITLASDPTSGGNGSSGVGGYYDFRLQPDSPLRDAGVGEFSNIGACDDTDVPDYDEILDTATFNDIDGTATEGGGGIIGVSWN